MPKVQVNLLGQGTPTMKRIDLAYAAGIFDGEGSVSFQKSKSHKQSVFAQVTNTNEWICQQFKFWFGGSVGRYDVKPGQWKVCWRWRGHGEGAVRCLELLLPYLRLKRPQAELTIAFQNAKRENRSVDVIEQAQKVALSHLNKRGI